MRCGWRGGDNAIEFAKYGSGSTVLADMPGVPKARLALTIEGDALLIEATSSS
jgi:hypothetical protein